MADADTAANIRNLLPSLVYDQDEAEQQPPIETITNLLAAWLWRDPELSEAQRALAVYNAFRSTGYVSTVNAIASILAALTDTGSVHIEDRQIRDEARMRDLFEVETGDGRQELRGWRVHRDRISERWATQKRTVADEVYVLRGLLSVHEASNSERRFNTMLESVWNAFRDVTTVGTAHAIDCVTTPDIGYVELGGVACHYAELEIVVTEVYVIAAPDSGQPPHRQSTAADRDAYGSIAGDMAAYIATLEGAGKVHAQRRYSVTRDEMLNLYATDTDDGRKTIRTWQVFRQRDDELRGIGQHIAPAADFRIQGARSWVDSLNSGWWFQQHVDDVRAVFRGLGMLGNTLNTTLGIHEPLQVDEIGARTLRGVVVHFADCALPVSEVVHA